MIAWSCALARAELEDQRREQKKARLHQEWTDKVFNRIQSQIAEVLDSVPVEEIARRRLELFEQFLHQTNTKAGLFRDIIIPAEYNPLAGRKHAVRYRTSDIDDPVKQCLTRVAKERKNVGFIDEGEKREMLREMFDVKLWDKVESTPHGHYSKMFDAESKAGHRVPLPDASRKPDAQKCSIVLDHYNYDRSYKSTAAELPKGKRTFPDKM